MAAMFFSLWIMGFMSRMRDVSAENTESIKMADGAGTLDANRTTRIFSDEENQQETDDEKLERQYFWKVVEAFLYYK